MTRFYGIGPWDIPKLTLFQWQDYVKKIAEIVKLFQPKEVKEGTSPDQAKTSDEELKQILRRKHIKPPRKGL